VADQLKNILHFIAVPAGGTASLAHGLNEHGIALIPDFLDPNPKGLTVTANATTVTVTNTTLGVLNVDVLCEAWHTIERTFGAASTTALAPQPYVSGGEAGSATSNRQTFRYTVTGLEPNLLDLTIPFPLARPNTSFNVQVTGGGLTNQLTFDTPVTGYTVAHFHAIPSGAVTAGDVLLITVEDLT
jgi:hypothetical protein